MRKLVLGIGSVIAALALAALILGVNSATVVAQSPPSCSFTDHPLVSQLTPIKGQHVTELRTCVNNIRAWLALSPASWTDPTISTSTLIKAVHLIEIAVALNAAYTAASVALPQWGAAPVAGVSPITVNEIGQIRSAITILLPYLTCTQIVTPLYLTVPASGGLQTLSVTAPAACSWSSTEQSAFVTIETGASGNGNGTVTIDVQPNTSSSPRTATANIAGHIVSISQWGSECTVTVNPSDVTVASDASTRSVLVSSVSGCSWQATSLSSFLTIVGASSGSGEGIITYALSANTSSLDRVGELAVGAAVHTVTQVAGVAAYSSSIAGYVRTGEVCGWEIKLIGIVDGKPYYGHVFQCFSLFGPNQRGRDGGGRSEPYVVIPEANVAQNKIQIVLGPINADVAPSTVILQVRQNNGQLRTIAEQTQGPGWYVFTFPFEDLPDGTYTKLIASWGPAPDPAFADINLRAPICSGGEADQRTALAREYRDSYPSGSPGWLPYCSAFASTGGSTNFSWANWSQGSDHQGWAVAQPAIFQHLEAVLANYALDALKLESGYRCPVHNAYHINPAGAANSRHLYGDAADLTPLTRAWNFAEYQILAQAATAAGADFIEPWGNCSGCTTSHVHADWRTTSPQ